MFFGIFLYLKLVKNALVQFPQVVEACAPQEQITKICCVQTQQSTRVLGFAGGGISLLLYGGMMIWHI